MKIKEKQVSKSISNQEGLVYEIWDNNKKVREFPARNLDGEIQTAEKNRSRYQERADYYFQLRESLKTFLPE